MLWNINNEFSFGSSSYKAAPAFLPKMFSSCLFCLMPEAPQKNDEGEKILFNQPQPMHDSQWGPQLNIWPSVVSAFRGSK